MADPTLKMAALCSSGSDFANFQGEALTAYYRAFRISVQKKFEQGVLTDWVHRELMSIAEEAAEKGSFIDASYVSRALQIPLVLRLLWKVPCFRFFLRTTMFHQIHRGTLMAFGFFYGQEDIINNRDQYIAGRHHAEAEKIATLIEEEATICRAAVLRDIQRVNEMYPDVLMAVKTRVAARHILNMGRITLKQLGEDGALEMADVEMLTHLVEHRMADVQRKCPSYMDAYSGEQMFVATAIYQSASADVQSRLLQAATEKTYQEGELLYERGAESNVDFVVDGIVIKDLEDGTRSYVGTGQWIGLFPTVTSVFHASTLRTETNVKMLSISPSVFKDCIKKCPNLEKQVWNHCAHAWANRMMDRELPFKEWSQYKRARWTLKGEILDLNPRNGGLHLNLQSIKLKLLPNHSYILMHGRGQAGRRRAVPIDHRGGRDSPPLNSQWYRATDLADVRVRSESESTTNDSFSCVDLETLVGVCNDKEGQFTGPCLLPPNLKSIHLSPDSKVFHVPPSDGLWNLKGLSHRLELNPELLHHDNEISDGSRTRESTMNGPEGAAETGVDVYKPRRASVLNLHVERGASPALGKVIKAPATGLRRISTILGKEANHQDNAGKEDKVDYEPDYGSDTGSEDGYPESFGPVSTFSQADSSARASPASSGFQFPSIAAIPSSFQFPAIPVIDRDVPDRTNDQLDQKADQSDSTAAVPQEDSARLEWY
uniref:Cyclic nucleotide-binding domain-containing protein n=1 Tax=Eutreptiella gymnastica TaxID=73025 RepID=A0A7S1NT85_9EUGL